MWLHPPTLHPPSLPRKPGKHGVIPLLFPKPLPAFSVSPTSTSWCYRHSLLLSPILILPYSQGKYEHDDILRPSFPTFLWPTPQLMNCALTLKSSCLYINPIHTGPCIHSTLTYHTNTHRVSGLYTSQHTQCLSHTQHIPL